MSGSGADRGSGAGARPSAGRVVSTLLVAFILSLLWRPNERPADSTARAGGRHPPRADGADGADGAAGSAETPGDIPPRGWWEIAKRLYARIGDDRILAVAAGVTFYGLLAVFPAIAALVSIYGLMADAGTISDQLASLGGVVPSGALDIITEQIKRITSKPAALGFGFAIGLATSLWSSNAGMKAIFDALNVAYEERETRSFIKLNAMSLVFTFATLILVVAALGAVVVLPIVFKFDGFGGLGSWLLAIGRWPAMLLAILLGLAVLYRFGPSRKTPQWLWVSPGSLLAGIGWVAFSAVFTWYVSSFGSYNETYGSLGAAIGFMTWMWLSSTIILIGAELNAITEQQAAQT